MLGLVTALYGMDTNVRHRHLHRSTGPLRYNMAVSGSVARRSSWSDSSRKPLWN